MASNPVVSGLLNGVAIANQIRQAAYQNEQLRRQKIQDEREAQLQDLGFAERMLTSGALPVEGGSVAERLSTTGPAGTMSGDVLRKADAKRTVRYKTREGQALEYELPTPEAQLQRKLSAGDITAAAELRHHMNQVAAEIAAKNEGAVSGRQALLDRFGIPVSHNGVDYGRVLPTEADDVGRLLGIEAKTPGPAPHLQNYVDEITGDVTPTATLFDPTSGKPTIQYGEPARGKARKRPPQEQGLTPGQAAVQERFEALQRAKAEEERRKQIDKWQKKVDDLQAQKNKLANRNTEIGQLLTAGVKKGGGKSAKARTGELQAELAKNQAAFAQLEAEQKAAQVVKNGLYRGSATPPESAPAAQAPRQRATNPKTGEQVEWDGKAWVPVQ